MTWRTHLVGGAVAAEAVTIFAMHIANEPTLFFPATVATGVIGGLVPDIDHSDSKITNSNAVTKGISKIIRALTSHRGITHVPVLWGILALVVYILSPSWLLQGLGGFCIWGFFIGIGSHLILDTLNRAGVMWLWPFSKRHWCIAWIKTGTTGERIVRYILIGCAIALVMVYAADWTWHFL